MSDTLYDIIKAIALLLAPLCTFIIAVLGIFNVVDNKIAVMLASAVDTLLGGIVTIAKQLYDEKHTKVKKTSKKAS